MTTFIRLQKSKTMLRELSLAAKEFLYWWSKMCPIEYSRHAFSNSELTNEKSSKVNRTLQPRLPCPSSGNQWKSAHDRENVIAKYGLWDSTIKLWSNIILSGKISAISWAQRAVRETKIRRLYDSNAAEARIFQVWRVSKEHTIKVDSSTCKSPRKICGNLTKKIQ